MAKLIKAAPGGSKGLSGSVLIDNSIPIGQEEEPGLGLPPIQTAEDLLEELTLLERPDGTVTPANSAVLAEFEKIKSFYRAEGEKALSQAREQAEKIVSDTKASAEKYADDAKHQAEDLFEKTKQEGFSQGIEEGYKKGILKCKDLLLDIKAACDRVNTEKDELFASYEAEIFDAVLEIVNRVTLNSVAQKDKAIIRKTIKEAGKNFRNTKYVKVSLSGTDVTEEMTADPEFLKKLFNGVETVELEILEDAPQGTVILESGSEITDASIMTQLKMIEELGRGKYRKAPGHPRKKPAPQPVAQVKQPAPPAAVEAENAGAIPPAAAGIPQPPPVDDDDFLEDFDLEMMR